MSEQDKTIQGPLIQCNVCLKEIPASEAKSAEALDYVSHFCGLECYELWRKQSEKADKSD